jgi:hypothetical protein
MTKKSFVDVQVDWLRRRRCDVNINTRFWNIFNIQDQFSGSSNLVSYYFHFLFKNFSKLRKILKKTIKKFLPPPLIDKLLML